MGFVDAVKTFYRRYTDLKGRSSRSEFWWFMLFNFVIAMILLTVFGDITGSGLDEMAASGEISFVALYGWPYIIWGLAHLVGVIALMVRRTHDWGKTGWLNLLVIIPIVGFIWTIINGCIGSTPGPNQYGGDSDVNTFT